MRVKLVQRIDVNGSNKELRLSAENQLLFRRCPSSFILDYLSCCK